MQEVHNNQSAASTNATKVFISKMYKAGVQGISMV